MDKRDVLEFNLPKSCLEFGEQIADPDVPGVVDS